MSDSTSNSRASSRGGGGSRTWIALLGRRDTPTDGVEDYCTFLARALAGRGVELRQTRVPWHDLGWPRAIAHLWRESAAWQQNWILLQYTALGWSRRGFPLGAWAALAILRLRGIRCAMVFHESRRQWNATRAIDRLRGACQDWVVRSLYARASKSIFTSPLDHIAWLPAAGTRAVFIPIGANIPGYASNGSRSNARAGNRRTVAVFCLSDPPNLSREVADISLAVRGLMINGTEVQLVFLGRGTAEAKGEIERAFEGSSAKILNLGVLAPEEISRVLSESDSMLCVRGPLYPGRSSALAGIACGLPIIGYAGACAGTPIAEAGVELVPHGDRESLARAIAGVLNDPHRWQDLHERSLHAQQKYFSWDVIAEKFREALDDRVAL